MTNFNGKYCWVDLTTTNIEASKRFYSDLFQWNFEEEKAPQGGTYHIAKVGDSAVAGLMTQSPEQKGAPSSWNTYFGVDSLETFSKKAEEFGAQTVVARQSVGDHGALSVLKDPTGAYFCTWQSKNPADLEKPFASNTPGHFGWTELATNDLDRAGRFYSEVFEYTPAAFGAEQKDATYFTFNYEGKPQAGLMGIPSDKTDVPSHWANYVTVENCDRTLEKATQLGAQTLYGPVDVPNVGRFAKIRDPQGAVIAFIS